MKNTKNIEITDKMSVEYIEFRYNTYIEPKVWTATAKIKQDNTLSYYGTETITIKLKDDIAEKLLQAILPFVIQSASESAQEFADQAKTLVNNLSNCITKQLTSSENKV